MQGETKKVLVVEDNLAMGKVIQLHLQLAGFRASTAGNGMDACILLDQEDFDLAVIDYAMPVMDGRELGQRIRRHPRCSQMPLVLITADDQMDLAALRRELDLLDALVKPINFRALTDLIKEHLRPAGLSGGAARAAVGGGNHG